MADETQNAGATLPSEDAAKREAGSTVQPPSERDRKLADILGKQARGETLSKAEIGFLGGIRRKKNHASIVPPSVPPPAAPASTPLPPIAPKSENPLLAAPSTAGPGQATPLHETVRVYNSEALRKTADGICAAVDGITKFVVGDAARKAGGNDSTVEKYRQAVALQPENRSLIVEGSEPAVTALCEALKVEPDKLDKIIRSSGLVAGLSAHFMAVKAALDQIKQDKLEHEKSKIATQPKA